jgi:sugar/nucleoside kinase (ribokinase family)
MKKYVAYGIGAALVDTEVKVTDEELARMNVDKGMMTLVDEARQAQLLSQLEGHLIKANHASGGSAGNSMIATAQFGGPTFMSCKVAADADGDIYLADLEAAGVDHCLNGSRAAGTTGKCLVLITADAERSMNTYLVTSPTGLAAAVRAREIAEAAGVKTAVSFSDPGMVEFFREGMASIVGSAVDLVFCNEAEALQWGETDSLQVAIEKLKRVARSFVITLGANGAITWDGNEQVSIPPHQVQAVDSNGAGDMFAGAFLYAITRGEDFSVAGRFASLAAGRIVANYGPRLPAADYPALRAEFFGD